MPAIFNAKDSALLLQNITDPTALLPAICNRNLEYERTRELIERTTLQGYEVGHILGLKRGSVTFNNLSVFLEPGDDGYYDELCRQWFESGDLILCKLRDVEGANIREIIFFGYMESYRIVRNNNEVANFDITIRQSDYDASISCPVTTIVNTNDAGNYVITASFATNSLATTYTLNLYDDTDTLVETQEFTTFGTTIEAVFDTNISANALYTLVQVIDGIEVTTCTVGPFISYNIACPILDLTVGETTVDVSLTPPTDITRIVIQLADTIDPVNILDFVLDDTPFADPIASFTALSTTTTYYLRAVIQTITTGVIYSRTCGWVEFTTGEPYVPPTSYPYTALFAVLEDNVCDGLEYTVYSDSETWGVGSSLYFDAELTEPFTSIGFDFVAYAGTIYNYIGATGTVGELTGNNCP